MADGVFMGSQSGLSDTVGNLLQARYAAAAAAAAQQYRAQQDDRNLRAGVLGRLTLSGPGGAPATPNDYLAAVYGSPMPAGVTATPTPVFSAQVREQGAQNVEGQKSADEMKKLGVSMRQHWAGMLQPGQTQKAAYFAPPQVLAQYGISPEEKIGSAQKPASTGGKGGAGSKDTGIKASDVQKLVTNMRNNFKDSGWWSQHFGDASRMPSVQKAFQNIEAGVTAGTVKTAADVDTAIINEVAQGTITGDEARTMRQQFHGGKK